MKFICNFTLLLFERMIAINTRFQFIHLLDNAMESLALVTGRSGVLGCWFRVRALQSERNRSAVHWCSAGGGSCQESVLVEVPHISTLRCPLEKIVAARCTYAQSSTHLC
jgi:hypothetical protein